MKPVMEGFKTSLAISEENLDVFDFSGDTIFGCKYSTNMISPPPIWSINLTTGDTITKYERPDSLNTYALNGITYSPDSTMLWVSFENFSGVDIIYTVHTKTKEWVKRAELEGIYHIEVNGKNVLALSRVFEGMGMKASIFLLDLTGAENHKKIIDFGAGDSSWSFGIDKSGNLYSAVNDMAESKLFRWEGTAIQNIIDGTVTDTLETSHATEILSFSDFGGGIFACQLDEVDSLLFNYFYSGKSITAVWNGIEGAESGYDTIAVSNKSINLTRLRVNGSALGKEVNDGVYVTGTSNPIVKFWSDKLPYMATSFSISGKADDDDLAVNLDNYFDDPDDDDDITYTLSVQPNPDIANLSITERKTLSVDFLDKGETTFELTVTSAGQSIKETISLIVTAPDLVAPSDIEISEVNIREGMPDGTFVGTFTTIDENSGATHTYELFNSVDYPDNNSFTVKDDSLFANSMDYEKKSSYSILVKSTNNLGLSVEKGFTIKVLDVVSVQSTNNDNQMVDIYPNPTADIINIKNMDSNMLTSRIDIHNQLGQRVLSSTGKNQIDVSGLKSGNYHVLIYTGGKVVLSKQIFVK
jgi:hypothetical protein